MSDAGATTRHAVTTTDGVTLAAESTGDGPAVLFIHEFAGDQRSWAPQVAAFSSRYRCITYNARGYPPSEVPPSVTSYSQQHAVDDAVAVLDALGVEQAHVLGLSMGGFCALHLGVGHPERVRSLIAAGCGYGAHPDAQEGFRRECESIATLFDTEGAAGLAERYALGPARVQLQDKNPEAWAGFAEALAAHDSAGSALTMRGVQSARPSLYAMVDELAAVEVPTLILAGDEDDGCLDASLMLKRTMPAASLVVLPRTGHTTNLEEPERFNAVVDQFWGDVESGRWMRRDPRSMTASITGFTP